MATKIRRSLVIIGLATIVIMTPSACAFAAMQKMSPAQCARLKSKSACESCMRKSCGSNSCGTKPPAGSKSIQWGVGSGCGV
jgi:hypothetical protein